MMDAWTTLFSIFTIGSFLMFIIEMICMWVFFPTLNNIGIKVYSENSFPLFFDRLEVGQECSTNHALFKRVSKDSFMFRNKWRFLQVQTPFPIKGEIVRELSITKVVWRIPLGAVLFFTLSFIGWCFESLSDIHHHLVTGLISLGFGVILIALIVIPSLIAEVERIRLSISEMKVFLEQ